MPTKRHTPEQVINQLHEAEGAMAQGSTVVEAGSQIRVTRKTSYRWRDEYGSIRKWLGRVGAKTLYIEPGSPWDNSYAESFNGRLRDDLLDREISYISKEVQVLTEQ